jgi:hypothetical protein
MSLEFTDVSIGPLFVDFDLLPAFFVLVRFF